MSDSRTPPPPLAIPAPDPTRGVGLRRAGAILVAIGAALSLFALLGEGSRSRFAFAYLLGFVFCWSIVVGSLFFVALQHITRSVWSVGLRRVAEMFAAPIWLVALFFLPLVAIGYFHDAFPLFPWMNPAVVDGDAVLEGKTVYLNVPFFSARAAVFFLVWIGFGSFFVRQSLKQDAGEAGAGATLRMRKLAAPFLLLFGLTVTFASFDWMMSLEPHWFSTIFGVYVFAGMTLASLAAITLGVVGLRARGWLGEGLVTPDHLYSLGGLMFAFTCFWAYIAFSQFMLIWYGNLPEETIYFLHRTKHGWLAVSMLLALLRFVIPFSLLLARSSKTSPRRLAVVSVVILGGQLLDLYWLIMPQLHREAPALGWPELGPPLLLAGILILYVARFLGRHRAVAVGDPLLEKSRHFHL